MARLIAMTAAQVTGGIIIIIITTTITITTRRNQNTGHRSDLVILDGNNYLLPVAYPI